MVISKDIKNKRSQEIFISLFLPILILTLENNVYNAILICLGKHCIGTCSSQYCPIDDSQDREGTIFIPYSLAIQPAQKHSDF